MVAQMAKWATQDPKVPCLIPAWIQWDFASKYMASFTQNAILLITRIVWIQDSYILCYINLINFSDFSLSVVYSDQLYLKSYHDNGNNL